MNSKALQEYYNTESRGFRRRFDVDRMETDSVYRDSVRLVIRDSLMLHSPEFRKRIEEQEKEKQQLELKRQQDSSSLPIDSNRTNRDTSKNTIEPNRSAIKNEEEEGGNHEN